MIYYSHSALLDILNNRSAESPTSIELLRLRHSLVTGTTVAEVQATFGDEILSQLVVGNDQPDSDTSTIQILFLSSIRDHNGCTTSELRVTTPTLEEICVQLGVSSPFIDAVLVPSIWSKQSGGSFHRHDEEGELQSIDGFYHYFNEWDLGPLHVWFSYKKTSRCTTYLLVDCPKTVKEKIFKMANDAAGCFLNRPFTVDLMIIEECASWREQFIDQHRKQIFDDWHEKGGGLDPPLRPQLSNREGLQSLHQLSRAWNMIYEDLGDLEERLGFLKEATEKLTAGGFKHATFATEAFKFLQARNRLRRRWVTSFAERTKLIMGFVFGIASQNDNQTNFEIANLTRTIAEETQRDNSSMITIATMTMLFLPGTFISAIFSMGFFHYEVDNNGNEVFNVSAWFWLFFVLTIPLTLAVFAIYLYWRRKRECKMKANRANTSIPDPERRSEHQLSV